MNLAGPLGPKTNAAAVMAAKIHMAMPGMPKPPKMGAGGVPQSYREYQTHKIKAPIRRRGKAPKVNIPKGLSNPYGGNANV